MNIVEEVKAEADKLNILVYVSTVVSLCAMVIYAMVLTYKNGKLGKMVEKGKETLATISNLDINPGSSLTAIGETIRRKTMEKIHQNQNQKDEERLVSDDVEG